MNITYIHLATGPLELGENSPTEVKTSHILLCGLLFGGGFVLTPTAVRAEADSISALKRQIAELDHKVRELEQRQTASDELLEERVATAPRITAGSRGLSIASPDGNYDFRFGGLLQVDFRSYPGDANNTRDETFVLRRVRPRFRGTLFNRLDFDLQPEFAWAAGSNTVRILDAYGDFKFTDALRTRFGQFKSPVGLERLQGAANLTFMERGLPTNLVPTRDIGVMAHGKLFAKTTTWKFGVFNGAVDGYDFRGNFNINDSFSLAGSLFFEPFINSGIDALKGLGFGFATNWGQNTGPVSSSGSDGRRIRYVSAGFDPFFQVTDQGTDFLGDAYRLNPQFYYYYGPFGLLSEYVLSSTGYVRNGASTRLNNQAVSVQASYVLTGEDKTYGGVRPRRPVTFAEGGGWGAWEIAGTFGVLWVDPAAFSGSPETRLAVTGSAERAIDWGAGVNWYLTDNFKFQLNYIQTVYQGSAGLAGNRPTENFLGARLQVNF